MNCIKDHTYIFHYIDKANYMNLTRERFKDAKCIIVNNIHHLYINDTEIIGTIKNFNDLNLKYNIKGSDHKLFKVISDNHHHQETIKEILFNNLGRKIFLNNGDTIEEYYDENIMITIKYDSNKISYTIEDNMIIFKFRNKILRYIEIYYKQESNKILLYYSGKVEKNIYSNNGMEYRREYFEDSEDYNEEDIEILKDFENIEFPIRTLKYGHRDYNRKSKKGIDILNPIVEKYHKEIIKPNINYCEKTPKPIIVKTKNKSYFRRFLDWF